MRFGFVASVLFHLCVAGAALVWGRDWTSDRDLISEPSIPVELITEARLADVTNVPAAIEEAADAAPTEPEVPDDPVPIIEEPIIIAEVEPELVAPPAPPAKEEPEPEPEKIAEPEPEAPKPKPVPPKPKPVVKKPKPKPQGLDLDALLDKAKKANDNGETRKPRETPKIAEKARGGSNGGELTATETALVKAAMLKCWTPPDGAPNPEKLVVEVNIRLNRDGTLAQNPKVLNSTKINLSGNRFWKVAEQKALRAVVQCAPYDFLPQDRYDRWSDMTFNFAPQV